MSRKYLALVLLAVLMLGTACGMILSEEEKLISGAWEQLGLTAMPDDVYMIHYDGLSQLTNGTLDTSMKRKLPTSGYAIIFGAPAGMYGFYGMHTVLLNEAGDMAFHFDYSDHYDLYEDAMPSTYSIYNVSSIDRATAYLTECNYFAGMQNFAYSDSRETRGEALCKQKNVWYELEEERFDSILK